MKIRWVFTQFLLGMEAHTIHTEIITNIEISGIVQISTLCCYISPWLHGSDHMCWFPAEKMLPLYYGYEIFPEAHVLNTCSSELLSGFQGTRRWGLTGAFSKSLVTCFEDVICFQEPFSQLPGQPEVNHSALSPPLWQTEASEAWTSFLHWVVIVRYFVMAPKGLTKFEREVGCSNWIFTSVFKPLGELAF